jgi:hypothetical protein
MKHYNCESNLKLPLNSIILTTGIINAIHDNGGHIGKGYNFNKISKEFQDLPLNKNIQGKIKSMNDGEIFEPINVCSFPYSDKFIILDGRHRYVASFLLGYTQIPVNIITIYKVEIDEPPNKKLKK